MVRQVIKPRPGQISVVFYMQDPDATTLFNVLKEQQAQINNKFGEPPLQWWGAVRRGEQRLGMIKEDADPADETDWPNQHKWLADQLEKLIKVFRPRIERAKYKVSSQTPDLDKVLEKIAEIAKKSADGDYIYRGERAHHEEAPYCGTVTSGLYRYYRYDLKIDAARVNVQSAQTQILMEAREYIDEISDLELLARLQHYGDKTTLIDFTTDHLIALFFACEGEPREPGRVILLPKESYNIIKPPGTIRRADIQKCIFVQAPQGVVKPDEFKVVCIPANLKLAFLGYLRKHHDISTKTIYNDLHGFIDKRRLIEGCMQRFIKVSLLKIARIQHRLRRKGRNCMMMPLHIIPKR